MSSLRRRLNRVVLVLLGGLFLQWFVADRTIVHVVESEMESRLRHDADTLLATIELGADGQVQRDPRSPGTVYASAYSGHYFVIDVERTAYPFRIVRRYASVRSAAHRRPSRSTTSSGRGPAPARADHARGASAASRLVLSLGEDLVAAATGTSPDSGSAFSRCRWSCSPAPSPFRDASCGGRCARWTRSAAPSSTCRSTGRACRRSDAPTEILPLVDEINRLLAFVERRLQQSRTAIGNLSHAVKTPLTAMFRLLDDPRLAATPDLKRAIQEQADAIHVRIDRELKRARLAGDTPTAATFDPHAELPTLVRLLAQIHGDKPVTIQWTAPEGSLPFDRQDLIELVGNLADNACKWAHAQVRIEIRERDGIDVVVSDDGPGCSAEDLAVARNQGTTRR